MTSENHSERPALITSSGDGETPEPEERWLTLRELDSWLERPMIVLSLVWLALFIIEFTRGLSALGQVLTTVIWAIFVIDFGLRFSLAPEKWSYLRHNVLTAASLLLPAVRVLLVGKLFRAFQAARALRGLRLVKVIGSLNRGMGALGRSFARRGFGYVLALTILVVFAGAAGIYAFDGDSPNTGVGTYSSALWWTAMLITSIGSDYFPTSAEGRALCLVLSIFGFAVFGYVTATLATYFVGRDAEAEDAEVAGQASINALVAEVRLLREEVSALRVRSS